MKPRRGIAEGDVLARDRMVRGNLRLVVNIARGYTGKGLGLQDLIEEGNLGLLRAVEGLTRTMGTRFSTYASYWIKQSIKRARSIGQDDSHSRLHGGIALQMAASNIRLTEELAADPTPEEIASITGTCRDGSCRSSRKQFKSTIRLLTTDQSEAGWSLGEMVMDERIRSPRRRTAGK